MELRYLGSYVTEGFFNKRLGCDCGGWRIEHEVHDSRRPGPFDGTRRLEGMFGASPVFPARMAGERPGCDYLWV